MYRNLLTLLAAASLLALVAPAGASPVVEGWYGSGANHALLIVDFSPGDGDSIGFGYRFSTDSITGDDLLRGVAAEAPAFTVEYSSSGFVDAMGFQDGIVDHYVRYNWPDAWWSYWTSEDFGQTWAPSWVGSADRIITSGGTDGWLAKPGDDYASTPSVPVPEPTGMLALFGGISALHFWRRWK